MRRCTILKFRKKLPPMDVHCGRVLLESVIKFFNELGVAAIEKRRLLKSRRHVGLVHFITIVQLQPINQSKD